VLLEIVTGQRAIDHERVEEYNLVEWVSKEHYCAYNSLHEEES